MKTLHLTLALLISHSVLAEDIFPFYAWELFQYSTPYRESNFSFGDGGSSVTLSSSIIVESSFDQFDDDLPSSGIFGKGWPELDEPDLDKYIEFTITPSRPNPLFFGSIHIPFFRETSTSGSGEDGPRLWELRWSVDNFDSSLVSNIEVFNTDTNEGVMQTIDLWTYGSTSGEVTFRLYGYDAPSEEGSGGLRVTTHKLFITAGSRPPLLSIEPKINKFSTASGNRFYFKFLGAYQKEYEIQYSLDLDEWFTDTAQSKLVDDMDNEEIIYSSPYPDVSQIFFRLREK
jgi:hypothetical protein